MTFQASNASVQSIFVIMGGDGTDCTLLLVIVVIAPLDLCGEYFHGGVNRALANGTLPIQVIAQVARTLHICGVVRRRETQVSDSVHVPV